MKNNFLLYIGLFIFAASVAFLGIRNTGSYKANLSSGVIIEVPKSEWKKLSDTHEFAINYEKREVRGFELFPQVVTIYDEEFSNSAVRPRTNLTEIDPNLYVLDFFKVHQEGPTLQVAYDHGSYYVLSRQTFSRSSNIDPEASVEQYNLSLEQFDGDIRNTNYVLKNTFRPN